MCFALFTFSYQFFKLNYKLHQKNRKTTFLSLHFGCWTMKTLVWVVVVAATFICSEATPLTSEKLSKSRLIRGRPWHGFVKKPPIDPRAVQSPTQYHDSKVDNLDSSNLKTYKQVNWKLSSVFL